MATNLSMEDQEFLAQCEEEFKDRFTAKDEDFMKVFNAELSKPPVIENWWPSGNSRRHNDHRFNRRHHPYERYGNRDRGYQVRRDHDSRGYNDYRRHNDDRGSYDNRGYNDNRQRNRY